VTGAAVAKEASDAINAQFSFVTVLFSVFAGIALFVGSFIIWNTFSMVVAQRSREIALLRAIGATRRQVRRNLLVEAVLLGVSASAVGIGLGAGVAKGLNSLMAVLGFNLPSTSLQVRPATIAVSLAVGTVVTVLAALVPAHRATKVLPVEALRDSRPAPRRRRGCGRRSAACSPRAGCRRPAGAVRRLGRQRRAPRHGRCPGGRDHARAAGGPPARVGHRRSPAAARSGRFAGAAERHAQPAPDGGHGHGADDRAHPGDRDERLRVVAQGVLRDDPRGLDERGLFVTPASAQGEGFSPEVGRVVADVPGVAAATSTGWGEARFDGEPSSFSSVDPDTAATALELGVTSGSVADLGTDGLLVSGAIAASHGWTVGSTVPVEFAATGSVPLQVRGIFEADGYLDGSYVISRATQAANVPGSLVASVLVVLEDGADASTSRPASPLPCATTRTRRCSTGRQYEQEIGGIVDKLLTLVSVMLLLAVVIALLGIVNTLALSVYERTRELGLLRAVGMTTAQVRAMVRWESVVISLIGALSGVALGVGWGSPSRSRSRATASRGRRARRPDRRLRGAGRPCRCAGGDRSRSVGVPRRRPAGGGHRLICGRAARRVPPGARRAGASGPCAARLEERQHRHDPAVDLLLVVEAELLEHRADVLLDGAVAHVEPLGDGRVVAPVAISCRTSRSRSVSADSGERSSADRRASSASTTFGSSADPPRHTSFSARTSSSRSEMRSLSR
jgi:putative ABC transport system permease protein